MSKAISILSLIAAVASAVAVQLGAIKPQYGQIAVFVAAIAAAAGGALAKATDNHIATAIGVVIAVASAFAGFADLLPAPVLQAAGIVAVAFAAAGKSLFGDIFDFGGKH